MSELGYIADPHEADQLVEEMRERWNEDIEAALARQDNKHHTYCWSIGDPEPVAPTPTPEPPGPYQIEFTGTPIHVLAQCLTAPGGTATFDIQRSLDGGASYTSILTTLTTIAGGTFRGKGARFLWELPGSRALVAPYTSGAAPLVLWAGDMIKLVCVPSGAKSIGVQFRTQRLGEYALKGR